ncbi:MAG: Uma2 family endonuclease [Thermomicrobiales bacterium]
MTLEDFLALPEEKPALEFEDGVVSQKVSPMGKHSRLQFNFADRVNREAEPSKLAMAFPELRASHGGNSYVPDVSVYRWDRIPIDDTGEIANRFLLAPDVAVEIVSPGQSVTALVRRCLRHVENGAGIALLIDPADESVLSFRPGQMPAVLREDDTIDLGDVLPDFNLTVQDLFDSLRIS